MNWEGIFELYILIGVIVAMANMYNAIATKDPDRPKCLSDFILFIVAILVFWPCTLGANFQQWRR